ncbi:MAG: S8 family serine peptidase, partial [Dehalococcoidales bacterium]|nr:S8 family serine peptidase [Dehalococcoidales bacterium]
MIKSVSRVFLVILTLVISMSIIALPSPAAAGEELSGEIAKIQEPEDGKQESAGDFGYHLTYSKKGNAKLDSSLNRLIDNPKSAFSAFAVDEEPLSGETFIRVVVESVPGREDEAEEIASQAGEVETEYRGLIQVNVPVSELAGLAANESVSFVRLPYQAVQCDVTSEGVGLINADEWQVAGVDGSGVKVGIIDGGFFGYQSLQSQGELPADISTRWAPSLGGPGTSFHGAGCAEIIYDIAPGATYYFAGCQYDSEFGPAVDWLIGQDVDVISSSIGWPGLGPGDGTGPINEVVDQAIEAGILWVNAAGNHADTHWGGNFSDPDEDGAHNYSGIAELNPITVSEGQTIIAVLSWNDTWGSSDNDYDLYLID